MMEQYQKAIENWLKNPDEKTLMKVYNIVFKKENTRLKKELAKKQKLLDKKRKEVQAITSSIKELEKAFTAAGSPANPPVPGPVKERKKRKPRAKKVN